MSKLRFAAALLCATVLSAAAFTPAGPQAGGFATRATLMEWCADYAGQADQLSQFLADNPPYLASSLPEDEQARLSLMRALLMTGRLTELQSVYDTWTAQSPASPLSFRALAVMADARFFSGEYAEALSIYTELPVSTFPSPEREGVIYRKAVSMLRLGLFEEASTEFVSLLSDEQYNGVARFYLAYIDYVGGNYRDALKGFESLPPAVAQEMGADFYIAQILFAGRLYDRVLAMEQPLLAAARRIDTTGRESLAEAYRLLGESAYASGHSEQALGHLREHSRLHSRGGEMSARYILGVADYEAGDLTQAATWLTPVAEMESAIGQSATLYLGQCLARQADYSAAAIYFDRAARMPYDTKVSETALYDYAVAVNSGANVPFSSAMSLLEEFISRFPDSRYAPAAEEYLAAGYYREHRYADAIERISRVKNPSTDALTVLQRARFDLGADLLSAGRATEARAYLEQAAASTANRNVALSARLWLADCLYRLKDYKAALAAYDTYLSEAPRTDTSRPVATYNRAYALFQLGDYKQALNAFNDALKLSLSAALKADATLRVADCQNYTGNISQALATYRKAAEMPEASGTDYAIFQAANMLGVQGDNAGKAATLEQLLASRPQSSWCSAALAELVDARQALGDMQGARKALSRLQTDYPDSEQLRSASLALADALADKGETTQAVSEYENLIRRWPTSRQARLASENLQSLCTESGQLDRYLAFIKSVPGAPQPDADRVALLSYRAAMNAYEKNPADLSKLEEYVENYPSSADTADALLALATAYSEAGDHAKALNYSSRILTNFPHSSATAGALMIKAETLSQRGDNAAAEQAYNQLLKDFGNTYSRQALEGLMQVASTPETALDYATRFLALPDVPADARNAALLCRAKALIDLDRPENALDVLTPLSSDMRSSIGGEATVLTAQIYLNQHRPAQAEALLDKFVSTGCESPYWLARGYIALADAYTALGRTSLARQYLEALRENYPDANDEIKSLINNRLQ